MAVSRVKIKYASASGSKDSTQRSYTLVYGVWTDSAADGAITVRDNASLPDIGDVYSYESELDSGALCLSKMPRQIEAKLWEVTCQFKTHHGDLTKFPDPDDPLSMIAQRRWETQPATVYPTKDLDGNDYVNSAKQSYSPDQVATEIERQVFVLTRNESYFDFVAAAYYNNSINSVSFYGWPPKTVRLTFTAEEKFTNDLSYVQITYRMEFNENGWQKRLLDEGSFYLDDSDPREQVYPMDKNGIVSTTPIKLDGSGGKLADQENGPFEYNTFKRYQERNWDSLNL